jgi:hypothetical protein
MRLASLLTVLGALACAAQDQGFVNQRLLKADFLKVRQSKAIAPNAADQRCIRIDKIERIVPPEVDRSMILPMKNAPSMDRGILIPTPPFCRDVADQAPSKK